MTGKLAYITGTSGTGIQRALAKYQDWCKRTGRSIPTVISLEEDFLVPLAKPPAALIREMREEDVGIIDVLTLPTEFLTQIWPKAFERALALATDQRQSGTDVLLTFHASWYHHKNREFLSSMAVLMFTLEEARPDVVVTLVDNVYDVKSRLRDGLFVARLSQDDYLDAHLKLFRVLDWRNFEKLMSRLVAQVSGVDHFVLATRHSIETFHHLVFERDRPIVYLAHPISQVRRLHRRGGEDALRAEELTREINGLARALRDRYIVLEPTAIDELRSGPEVVFDDGTKVIVPDLTGLWPSSASSDADVLFDPPSQDDPPFGPEWAELGPELSRKGPSEWSEEDQRRLREAAALMLTLNEQIRMQIKSRDFTLVSQAHGLVVFRPAFDGNESGGVRQEINYHDVLAKADLPRAMTVVLHPPADEHEVHRVKLIGRLKAWHTRGTVVGPVEELQALVADITTEIACRMVHETSRASEAGSVLRVLLDSRGLHVDPGGEEGVMDDEPAAAARALLNSLGREIRELRSYIEDVGSPKIAVINEDLSAEQFADRVAGLVTLEDS